MVIQFVSYCHTFTWQSAEVVNLIYSGHLTQVTSMGFTIKTIDFLREKISSAFVFIK